MIDHRIKKYTNRLFDNFLALSQIASRRFVPFKTKSKDIQAYRIASWKFGKLKRESIENIFVDIKNISIKLENIYDRETDMSLDIYELCILCSLIKYTKATNVLEIGTFDGNTALNLAANINQDGIVYTVDLPSDKHQDIPLIFDNSIPDDQIGLQYKNAPYENKIKQIYSDSTKINWKDVETPLDLMFIDGCHYYEVVKKDTLNAIKYVRKGGLIVWHDYGMIHDVSKVVDETTSTHEVHAIQGTRLAITIN
jgi:predicted O-methyltransferase YrrM